LYKDLYKDDLYFINIKIIYINRNSEIEKIKQETFLMSIPNLISREEILFILKKYSLDDVKKYTLLSILRYNNILENDEINNFLLNPLDNKKFLQVIKNIDSIYFEKTISLFHDLNELIFIFYEKSNELLITNPYTSTKKIYINSNTKKKTIKKRYKD
jgi:hypothetical protein